MTDRAARRLVGALLARIESGTLVVREDGGERTFGSGPPVAVVEVRAPRAWRSLLRASRGLADSYAQRLWECDDLVALIRIAARNGAVTDGLRERLLPLRRPVRWARAVARPSTRATRRRDIAAHYDLGNALFSRMLDPTMTYSCAVFEHDGMSLEEAQTAKLERVCDRLALGPGDRVVEIGTGWGAFAVHAASTRGCHVTTTTISGEQHEHVSALVRRAGLSDRVTVLTRDYRALDGRFDKLVSIEMIEAVGWRHFGTFFAKCSELLEPYGSMLLQAITIDDRGHRLARGSRSFMNTSVFPNGCLPSPEAIAEAVARRTDLRIAATEDITAHYVPTLRAWRESFLAAADELAGMGYDERFRRIWTLYLAYCEAGFAERRIGDVQMLLVKPEHAGTAAGAPELMAA